jgi:asparagine synthase (glutamine-hydrolysing)
LTSFGVLYSASDASCSATLVGPVVEALGPYRIVGNIRLDARDDLRARLTLRDRDLSDLVLCLHAYAKWGERFVDVIAGDFGFALWDDSRRCLLAARDRLGIRPLFHALVGDTAFVSDSLDWIMSHAEVPRDLDEVWIGDFLTVGFGLDFDRSVRRHVRRVPPAHLLKVSGQGESLHRYWQLEIGDPIHFDDRRLYTERFHALLAEAVRDRLPEGRLGVAMSGGLDSPTLAATAVTVTGDPSRVVAECLHYKQLMPDQEAHFSSLVARKLGIELLLREADGLAYDPLWRSRGIHTAEPSLTIVQAHIGAQVARRNGKMAGVWFYGEGPDDALPFDRDPYFAWLWSRRDWRGLGRALLDYGRVKGVAGWRATLGRRFGPRGPGGFAGYAVPRWIDPEFAQHLKIGERLRGVGRPDPASHPWHPRAIGAFKDSIWPALFDDLRVAEAAGGFEWRHPFLDLRVLEYMMSLPPVPWAWRKHLLREAMRGTLPDEVLARNKSPLPRQPLLGPLRQHGFPPLSGNPAFAHFVVVGALPPPQALPVNPDSVVAAHALDYWLVQE